MCFYLGMSKNQHVTYFPATELHLLSEALCSSAYFSLLHPTWPHTTLRLFSPNTISTVSPSVQKPAGVPAESSLSLAPSLTFHSLSPPQRTSTSPNPFQPLLTPHLCHANPCQPSQHPSLPPATETVFAPVLAPQAFTDWQLTGRPAYKANSIPLPILLPRGPSQTSPPQQSCLSHAGLPLSFLVLGDPTQHSSFWLYAPHSSRVKVSNKSGKWFKLRQPCWWTLKRL